MMPDHEGRTIPYDRIRPMVREHLGHDDFGWRFIIGCDAVELRISDGDDGRIVVIDPGILSASVGEEEFIRQFKAAVRAA